MRRDIDKVVFERAKSNRTWVSKVPRTKPVLLDESGEHFNDAGKSRGPTRRKYRNSHFNAVERFLVRSVGRPWSKVYAEACKASDIRSTLGAEIRNHIEFCVATKCWLEGRKVMAHDWRGCPVEVRGLYVHPKTGLLMRTGPPGQEDAVRRTGYAFYPLPNRLS